MPRSRQTILVADDNVAARYATVRALRAAGFRTVESTGGAGALEHARQGVSAVVLDVHLPDLHGFEVCRLLRASPATSHLPVIHVSAVHVANEDQVTGIGAGADAYLLSPVSSELLVALLDALIRSREVQQALRSSENRLRGAFEDAPIAIGLVDGAGRIVEANPALARLVGYGREDLVGRVVSQMAPADWRARAESAVQAWKNGCWQGELPLLNAKAERIGVTWTVSPHREPDLSIAVALPLQGDAQA